MFHMRHSQITVAEDDLMTTFTVHILERSSICNPEMRHEVARLKFVFGRNSSAFSIKVGQQYEIRTTFHWHTSRTLNH
jgi:hypothetical protein